MDEQERKTTVETALAALAGAQVDDAFLIFSQKGQPENYVQMTPDGYTEVSLRTWGGSLPRLAGDAKALLRGLGFQEQESVGNAYRFFNGAQDPELPGIVERVFVEVYGAPAGYELDVDLHVEEADLDKRALAAAFPAPFDQIVAGWLGVKLDE